MWFFFPFFLLELMKEHEISKTKCHRIQCRGQYVFDLPTDHSSHFSVQARVHVETVQQFHLETCRHVESESDTVDLV